MNRRLSSLIFAAQFAALAVMAGALLTRDALAISWRVPLDPNEGWNAYHALAGWSHLYPPPGSLMVNNYPPLSFPLVAALARLTGDAIIAGRIVSLLSFLACGAGVLWLLRRMGCGIEQALFGLLVFACGLLVGSDYVAMDDPQLLGHALQIGGLVLLLQRPALPVAAGLAMAVALFVKHNLLPLPIAAAAWLALYDWRAALRFALAGTALVLVGLIQFRLQFGMDLAAVLASPRLYTFGNFAALGWRFVLWAGAAAEFGIWLAVRRRRDPWVRFAALYALVALVIGLLFAPGDGVDANIFFDATIALALLAGLMQQHFAAYGRAVAGMAVVLPLALFLYSHFEDDDFAYTAAFRAQAPGDIAFLRQGPALCEQLSLCYWAGEKNPVDVFNLGEAIATGHRSPAPLAALFNQRHFRSLQFDSLDAFALGPQVRSALLANYRIDHEDDNGVFLKPR